MSCSYREARFLIWVLSIIYLASCSSTFDLTGNYHIDCGSPTNTSIGNRVFVADSIASKFLSTSEDVLAKNSTTLPEPIISFGDSLLCQTARIFIKTAQYTFSISRHGRHFIRLYFSPFVFQNYDLSTANFSVFAGNYVLLSYFSLNSTTSVKEFSINVTSDNLVVSLIPLANSFAFLNAIEVISLPDALIVDDSAKAVDTLQFFSGLSTQVLEMLARVNMGGLTVSFENDTFWRTWASDQSFLLNKRSARSLSNIEAVQYVNEAKTAWYIAPRPVYGTATAMNVEADNPDNNFNLTWEFEVDQGFRYLVRFHFCDIVSTALNTLYFNMYIDSWNVAPDIDLSYMSLNTLGLPLHMDYVTMLAVDNKLRVSIGPSTLPGVDPNAILNGLEIMKIRSVMDSPLISSHSSLKKSFRGFAIGGSIGVFLLVSLALVFFTIWFKKRKTLALKGKSETSVAAVSSHGTHIPLLAVQEATNNFEDSRVIGSGGFGKVYKGILSDGTKVAVKRNNLGSQQGLAEFWTEIEMLSKFRHRHLVSLLGYCDEGNEMILVYEFVENGTLRSHLYGSGLPTLSWKQRLEICVGAARGLHYLHTGFDRAIIHRDVKSANILLDENLSAKVADFGLSKTGPDESQAAHVSTAVKGSFGYFDPEYFRRRRLTVKSDVYSFGVVLFEVLCGRAAVESTLPTEKIGLAGWAMKWQKMGKLEEIIDPAIAGEVGANSLKKFGETAEKCLAEFGANRPSMGQVLRDLERAVRLHEAEAILQSEPGNVENGSNVIADLSLPVINTKFHHSVSAIEMSSHVNDLSSGVKRLFRFRSQ